MPNPLISVIVPIYNVEKYVRKCLDSLKNQTMKQIEVICIDDGSTDESGRIAEEYKNEEGWPRFRIIHTENRGLSAARNRGIDEARAGWIMFVDSDDWVEKDFCRAPYEIAIENQADMIIFAAYVVKNGRIRNPRKTVVEEGTIKKTTAQQYGKSVAWNKLYQKGLFYSIRYPEGRVFEDLATTHKIVQNAGKIVFLNRKLYYHLFRKHSISHKVSRKSNDDRTVSVITRSGDLISYYKPNADSDPLLCSSAISYLARTLPCEEKLYLQAREILRTTRKMPKSLNWRKKMAFITWKIDERLFYFLCRLSKRV